MTRDLSLGDEIRSEYPLFTNDYVRLIHGVRQHLLNMTGYSFADRKMWGAVDFQGNMILTYIDRTDIGYCDKHSDEKAMRRMYLGSIRCNYIMVIGREPIMIQGDGYRLVV